MCQSDVIIRRPNGPAVGFGTGRVLECGSRRRPSVAPPAQLAWLTNLGIGFNLRFQMDPHGFPRATEGSQGGCPVTGGEDNVVGSRMGGWDGELKENVNAARKPTGGRTTLKTDVVPRDKPNPAAFQFSTVSVPKVHVYQRPAVRSNVGAGDG